MKNLLVFLAFVLIIPHMAHATIQSPFSNSFDATGTLNFKDKVWIQVRNKTGTAFVRGVVVRYDVATYADGATVSLVTTGRQNPACVTDEAIADGAMGKCLIHGYHDAIYFDAATTSVAGEPMYASSTTSGYTNAIAFGSVTANLVKVGTFFTSTSTSGTIAGFINLP